MNKYLLLINYPVLKFCILRRIILVSYMNLKYDVLISFIILFYLFIILFMVKIIHNVLSKAALLSALIT